MVRKKVLNFGVFLALTGLPVLPQCFLSSHHVYPRLLPDSSCYSGSYLVLLVCTVILFLPLDFSCSLVFLLPTFCCSYFYFARFCFLSVFELSFV